MLQGYGNGQTYTLGSTSFTIVIDDIKTELSAHVVPNTVQNVPVLLGRNFSELPDIIVVKDDVSLRFIKRTKLTNLELNAIETDLSNSKIILRVAEM